MASISLRNIIKRYGHGPKANQVIHGVNAEVKDGEFIVIVGPSGCGKSTLLRMVAGLEEISGGELRIGDRVVNNLEPAQRDIAMVFQNYALYPHMTNFDNMAYGLKIAKVPKDEIKARVDKAAKILELGHLLERKPRELSGGQRQRVAMGRAIVRQPQVFLFDEPLSNLDARLRRAMREEIRALQQRLRLTVVYVTHDQSEALAVSDQIVVMDKGTIAQCGAPSTLYEQPASEFVAGFMGEAMLFEGHIHALNPADGESPAAGSHARLGPLRVPSPASLAPGPVKIAVRPEAWVIGPATSGGLAARLTKRTYLGSVMEYTFASALGEIFVVSPQVELPLDVGAPVSLTLADHGVSVVAG